MMCKHYKRECDWTSMLPILDQTCMMCSKWALFITGMTITVILISLVKFSCVTFFFLGVRSNCSTWSTVELSLFKNTFRCSKLLTVNSTCSWYFCLVLGAVPGSDLLSIMQMIIMACLCSSPWHKNTHTVSEQPRVKLSDDPTLWTLFWKQQFVQAICTGRLSNCSCCCAEMGIKVWKMYGESTSKKSKLSLEKGANIRELQPKKNTKARSEEEKKK